MMRFSRVSFVGVLGVLGLLGLVAGCGGDLGTGGPDPDPDPDPGLELDPDLDSELDDVDPPDGPAPDPFLYRSDTYDPVHHRFLTADCTEREVRSFDLATGQLTTVVGTWPWDGDWICPMDLALAPDGDRLLAFVDVSFDDAMDGGCTAFQLVDIDLDTGAVTPRHTYYEHCSDDHGPGVRYRAPLLDPAQQRVLFAKEECDPNACYISDLEGLTLGAADPSHLARFYELDCSVWPDWETCMDNAVASLGRDAVFHPTLPHRKLLVLMSDDQVIAIDLDTGRTAAVATLQRTWGDLTIDRFVAMTLDPQAHRLFVAGLTGWVRSSIVTVDLDTGQQSLLHDGGPNVDGEQLRCPPRSLSFDSQAGRLLLYQPVSASEPSCTGEVFAIDATTGALDELTP